MSKRAFDVSAMRLDRSSLHAYQEKGGKIRGQFCSGKVQIVNFSSSKTKLEITFENNNGMANSMLQTHFLILLFFFINSSTKKGFMAFELVDLF